MVGSIVSSIHLERIFTPAVLQTGVSFVLILIVGYVLVRLLAIGARRLFAHNLREQSRLVLTKAITYTGYAIVLVVALNNLGIKLSALLGAAGVVGIAIGIASQASLGNIISGLFLVSEKAFAVGDVVTVGTQTGVVYSIDALSIKLRTFDNLLIRIPNQTLITSNLTNVTRFPIRRMDFTIGVAYKEDLVRVRDILLEIVHDNPLCLDEPEPLLVFNEFGTSSINILLGVWFEKSNYLQVHNSVFLAIKERFDAAGIELPFPHQSLYTGSATEPFPIRIVGEAERIATDGAARRRSSEG